MKQVLFDKEQLQLFESIQKPIIQTYTLAENIDYTFKPKDTI